jgi:hypothetical protein
MVTSLAKNSPKLKGDKSQKPCPKWIGPCIARVRNAELLAKGKHQATQLSQKSVPGLPIRIHLPQEPEAKILQPVVREIGESLPKAKPCNSDVQDVRKETGEIPADMRKSKTKAGFCNSVCWYAFNQKENHCLWAGGQDDRMNPNALQWRKKVLIRDKHHCRICHDNQRLEVHHIKPFGRYMADRWIVANGLTLCHKCHAGFRHREMEYSEILTKIAKVPVMVWKV